MELKELTPHLESIREDALKAIGELKTAVQQQLEEAKKGFVTSETKEKVDRIETRLDQLQAQLTDPTSGKGPDQPKSLGDLFTKSEKYMEAKKGMWRKNDTTLVHLDTSAFPLEAKATITSTGLGTGTSGISMPTLLPGGPVGLGRQELRLRNLLRAVPMTEGYTYYYLVQNTRTNAASPQVEAAAKAESTYNWTTASGDVKTIAHYTKVTRQALDDVPWLRRTVDDELMYGLLLKEEAEILSGVGTGEHLNGLITQATARASTWDVAGDTKLDKLRHAKLQARLAGLATFAPDGLVLNPKDMHDLELIKSDEGTTANRGLYIIGDPRTGPSVKVVWGLPVVESDSIASGTFLLGAFGTAAYLIDRMAATIDISFENEDDWVKNKATIRCEERLGLAVTRPTAFITGTI